MRLISALEKNVFLSRDNEQLVEHMVAIIIYPLSRIISLSLKQSERTPRNPTVMEDEKGRHAYLDREIRLCWVTDSGKPFPWRSIGSEMQVSRTFRC